MNKALAAYGADETVIRDLVENWARAVGAKDPRVILANHSLEIPTFEVEAHGR